MTWSSRMGILGSSAASLKQLEKAGQCTLLILQLSLLVRGCTIYEFNGSGFAANAFAIAHMVPIFHSTNGTFFLDNTKNHYKCSEEGGWHDFFGWEDQVRPVQAAQACVAWERCKVSVRHWSIWAFQYPLSTGSAPQHKHTGLSLLPQLGASRIFAPL